MKITYNIEWLKKIVEDICEITNISISITDTKYNEIYRCEKGDGSYCRQIQATERGRILCHHSDIEMYKKCAEQKKPVSCICHAGVIDTAVPILKNGIVAGFIMLGRVRSEKSEPCAECLLEYSDDAQKLKKQYKKLTYLSDSQLSSIINLLSHILFENAIEVGYDEFINYATDYIENNLSEDLSVPTLCKAFHISKNSLYKEFNDFYRCTVNQYITTRRIEKAKYLLYNTNQNIALVAQATGFYNYTYFSKLFKKFTGLSPSEYRKQKPSNL